MSNSPSKMQARKQLLLARASIERLELSAHLGRVRSTISPSSLLRAFLPPGMLSSRGPAVALSLFQTLRRYPIVSSAASMLIAKISLGGIFRVVKIGGGVFAAYQAFKLWRSVQDEKND